MERCGWSNGNELYETYHDTEWGVPVYDAQKLFENLTLEGFQAGLSWITILRKRENFRKAFANFDPNILAQWEQDKVTHLLENDGIIRHRGKIEATLNNAKVWQEIEKSEGFCAFVWSFVDGTTVQNNRVILADVPASTPQSTALSKALKKRGFKFCGPITVYAFMQSCGMVNDHLITCPAHSGPIQ